MRGHTTYAISLAVLTACGLTVLAPLRASAADATDGGSAPYYEGVYYYDSLGRRVRTTFDPGNRLIFSSGWEGLFHAQSADSLRQAGTFTVGLLLRDGCDGQQEDCWKSTYDFLISQVIVGRKGARGWPAGQTQLYSGDYVRYLTSPYLTVPTSPPRKLFVPFNFGVAVDVGRLSVPTAPYNEGWDVGVIDTRLLLDFWRTPRPGSGLKLGVGIKYDVHVTEMNDSAEVEHILAPFTATSLRFQHESRNGFHKWAAEVDASPAWSDHNGWGLHVHAQATYELVLVAVNDNPISLYSSASYRYDERSFASTSGAEEFVATAGLTCSVPMD